MMTMRFDDVVDFCRIYTSRTSKAAQVFFTNYAQTKALTVFTARRSYASAVLGVVILSVRPYVRPSVCPSVTRVLCD